jgi:long-chain acyl-CoA synthetase
MKAHIAHMIRDRAAHYGTREVFRYRRSPGESYQGYSWNELTRDADKVSRALISLGFGHESLIGLFSDNRLEWTITDIGILGIRGVVVPFFGTASRSQVKYIVDETGMQLMFVGNKEQLEKATWLLDHTGSLKKIIVFQEGTEITDDRCISWKNFLKLGEDPLFGAELEVLYDQAQPFDLATILYTSGTTGEPKGVMLGHENFMESFDIHDNRLDITDKDISMCFLPLSHVFERTWTFYLLHCGAVNVFLENPRDVISVLPVVNPTVMCTVPRFFEKTYEGIQIETAKWPKIKKSIFDWAIAIGHQCNEYKRISADLSAGLKFKRNIAEKVVLKKLRNVFGKNMRQMPCAGAAIREDLLRFFHATGLFVNFGYGATETTATVSCFKNDRYEFESCGTVMPGLAVKFSEEGEIMIKGPTVFRGYYKKPEETAKALKDGWYMSGDQGSYTKDGNLVMSDRIKDLFKTSVGKYVSPQKLELLLGQEKLIEQVIVVGDNRKYVTALIVPSFSHLNATAEKLGLDPADHKKIASNEAIKQIYQVKINEIQAEVTPYERVVKFTLLTEPFSVENSAMTSTLKLRRKVITEQYKEQIELMYSAD